MENPYQSPAATPAAELPPERERYAQLGEVFVAWEWLRIWYNVVLSAVALIGVLVVDPRLLTRINDLEAMAAAAVGANACFFAGPIVEGYVTWWFGPVSWLRKAIFVMGTLGSVLLVVAVIVALNADLLILD